MNKIEAYKTSDGKVFELEHEAIQHQARLDFKEWYLDNYYYGDNETYSCDILDWMLENRGDILRFLNEL